MRLKDKVAIITGGSRGIGFATADKFLKEGATVVLAASSQESADTAVDKLKEKYPNTIVAGISLNLASMESVRKAFKEAIEKYGCVDILVNNAGISENTSFMDYTEETFDKVMDLNVKGVFNTTRVAAECMVARGKGVILSTSSMVSISGQPSGFAYPASKFAVNGLTVSLARELGPNGNEFTELTNNTLNVRLQKADTSYEYFTLQAKDKAGNMSEIYKVGNPYYENPDAVKENTEVSGTEQNAASLPADGTASKPTSATATVTEHQTTNETATAPTEPEYRRFIVF